MKISEFKQYIRETIVGVLSEEEGTVTTDDPKHAEELSKKGTNVNLVDKITENEYNVIDKATGEIVTDQPLKKDLAKKFAAKKKGWKIEAVDTAKKTGDPVSVAENEDAEPSKAELQKTKSLAKAKEELAQLTKKMKAKAKDYKSAEGKEKDKIKDELKKMTAEKKKLEKSIQ